MTEKVFEGRMLEEALEQASTALGIDEPDLDYEIIEQGRRGLFGLGARSVRIRVVPRDDHRAHRRAVEIDEEPADDAPSESNPHVEAIHSTTQRILDLLQLEVEVRARAVKGGVELDMDGRDRKLLRHRDGETQAALQFLLNRMARRTWPECGRITVSRGSGRKRRDDELTKMTRDAARQVARTGRAKRLQEMNSYERRMVHLAVREFDDLGSRSEGDGYLKRVRIFKQKRELDH